MTTLEHFVSPALTRALGWTLLHSLWQGVLVAAVLAGALLLLRRQRAEVRYVASAGALGMVVALAGITFGLYINAPAETAGRQSAGAVRAELVGPNAWPQAEVPAPLTEEEMARMGAQVGYDAADIIPGPVAEAASPSTVYAAAQSLVYSLNDYLPLLVVAWLLGLLAMSLRMLGGLLYVQRLRSYRVRPLNAAWQERFAALAARSGVRRPVALLESALVQVPLVVGHWRPVILLPLGAVAGLTPAYLEAILAHELAHVLRRDYLVNLLQTVAEVLFFYHPAVWFVANCVRTERENCCDDQATALVGGDPLRLARALTALAEWTQSAVVPSAPRLAVAAMGQRGALLNRVRRLVQRRPAAPTLAEGIMASALVLGGLGLLGGSVALARPSQLPAAPMPPAPAAIDWQAGLAQASPQPADTTRYATGLPTTVTSSSAVPTVLEPAADVVATPSAADADAAPANEAWPRPKRGKRRVTIIGRDLTAFPDQPGTVVVTKDKKGRLTDLVVNGQHVETEADKGQHKKRKGEQVEIIQLAPVVPDMRALVYQSDAEGQRRLFERTLRGQDFSRLRNLTPLYQERLSARLSQQLKVGPGGQLSRTYSLRPGKMLALVQNPGTERDALRSAERALQDASTAKNLTAEQRRRISQSLEKVRDQLRQLDDAESASSAQLRSGGNLSEEQRERQRELRERIREAQQELRDLEQAKFDRDQAVRDQAQARFDRMQAARDRAQADRDRLQADRDRAQADRDRTLAERDRTRNEDLLREMQKDGLIKDANHYHIRLTAKRLVIDGQEQPPQVFRKYLKLHESGTGHKLNAGDVMESTHDSDSVTSTDGPTPPRPPRAPRAPRASGAAPAPPAPPTLAPPAPPAPPRYDPGMLRSELRKDGLISAKDKSFQLQLNNSGLTVNGKKQSDELAAKYRKLTGHADGKEFNMSISSQE